MPKVFVFVHPKVAKMKFHYYVDRIRDLKAEQLARKLGNSSVFYFKNTPNESKETTQERSAHPDEICQ